MTFQGNERGTNPTLEHGQENVDVMRANGNVKSEKTKSAADTWKGIGNRHMASQEYEEAYKAYSTALSISPLGPSSHIYLSNRAAALLSLKRYSAASVDARRAITLAPTFGKAHARLGQSLYFLKDYAGAVAAYQNAFQFEPDNQVTWTYLNKAKKKFARENEKRRKMEEEERKMTVGSGSGSGSGGGATSATTPVMRIKEEEEEQVRGENYYMEIVDEKGFVEGKEEDGASVSETVDLARMAIADVRETNNAKDRSVAVLSTAHDQGDDIDQIVAAVDRGESSIVRGKIQAALDSSLVKSMSQTNEDLDNSFNEFNDETGDIDDPDFDEALRLHEVATLKLVNKEYKSAVEEFSAALFLVPDDTNLTPQLYIGRAHALNGLQRHEGALNDSMMALGRNPHLPEAHVVLARTYFYAKNFQGAISSFDKAREILIERDLGDKLSPLDELYYEKACETLNSIPHDESMDEEASFQSKAMRAGKPVPKLKPPRFVSRQELLRSAEKLNVPPMPKAFANQISILPSTLRVGMERKVTILSDSMGLTLNRGQDGFIRVLAVAPDSHGSKHTRRGEIHSGDIIREAAGVDLRRPLTQVMWSDTVAFMKFSPRPLHIVVSRELSEKPISVQEEFAKVAAKSATRRPDPPNGFDPPSRASGDESVSEAIQLSNDMQVEISSHAPATEDKSLLVSSPARSKEPNANEVKNSLQGEKTSEDNEFIETVLGVPPADDSQNESSIEAANRQERGLSDELNDLSLEDDFNDTCGKGEELNKEVSNEGDDIPKTSESNDQKRSQLITMSKSELSTSQQLVVLSTELKKDFIFLPTNEASASPGNGNTLGFTNTRWLAESSTRDLIACGDVFVFEKSNFFWQQHQFVPRILSIYTDLLVIGRVPTNAAEIRSCFDDPNTSDIFAGMPDAELMASFLIAETVIDFKTSKFRRSSLTTPSSIENFHEDLGLKDEDLPLRKICFEIVSPVKNYLISAVNTNEGVEKFVQDSKTMFLTTQWEESIKDALCTLHQTLRPDNENDKSWIHQIILGTLHSHVVTGNYSLLERAIAGKGTQKAPYYGIDAVDDNGFTVLHHACFRRSNIAVASLLNAGADCTKTTLKGRKTPCHISAQQLDANSLSLILSQTQPRRPDPNALNEDGHTPMTVAIMHGRAPGGKRNPSLLSQCISSLQAWGGKLHVPYSPHPMYNLSAEWCHDELEIIFPICDCSFPVAGNGLDGYSQSLGAIFDYPLHICVVQLRHMIAQIGKVSRVFASRQVKNIVRTLEVLLDQGFEPNERIEYVNKNTEPLNELIGFSPIQIVGAAALDLIQKSKDLQCDFNNTDFSQAIFFLSCSAEILITKGAILALDPPLTERFNVNKPFETAQSNSEPKLRTIDPSLLHLDKNKDIMNILNKNQSLRKCQAMRQQIKSVKGYGENNFLKGKGLSMKVEDCYFAGGSNDKSCAICWKKFGSIRNRKHICRASRRYVCDDCSTNTVVVNGDLRRVSDGQFNLAKAVADRKEEKDRIYYEEKKKERKARIEKQWAASHAKRNALQETQRDETAAKEELFGNVGRAVKNFFMEEVEVEEPYAQDVDTNTKVSGMMSSLDQTRQAFGERGEKLNTLVEKTSALKDASEDFAKMARELKESQQKGLFW